VNRYDRRGNVFGTAIAELKSQIDVLKREELVYPNCVVLNTDDEARALGKAAGLKVTAKSTKKTLIPKIVHFAQRNYENTAMVQDA